MARVGRPSVPHATAAGKVMLVFGAGGAQEPLEVATSLGHLERFTERTVCDPESLAEELRATGGRGLADAVGERELDLAALAAPVLGAAASSVRSSACRPRSPRLPAAAPPRGRLRGAPLPRGRRPRRSRAGRSARPGAVQAGLEGPGQLQG